MSAAAEPGRGAGVSTKATGPVVFAYDGSDLAKSAIAEAGQLMSPDRDALVVTVWQPFDVGFVPAGGAEFDAAATDQVRRAAARTAAEGASLATEAGFRAQSAEAEGSPTWKVLVDISDERDASAIVLGSHGRSGVAGVLLGSVAGAVASHSHRAVLIAHRRPESED